LAAQDWGAFGSMLSEAIPRTCSALSSAAGFAFIDFASRAEAQAAFEALQHSHLYGRRLVIDAGQHWQHVVRKGCSLKNH